MLYFKNAAAYSSGFPLGGFTLHGATVLLLEADGVLQVKSPVSYTVAKDKVDEARDRVFKLKVRARDEEGTRNRKEEGEEEQAQKKERRKEGRKEIRRDGYS